MTDEAEMDDRRRVHAEIVKRFQDNGTPLSLDQIMDLGVEIGTVSPGWREPNPPSPSRGLLQIIPATFADHRAEEE